jgi:hypothetical protein
MHICTRACTRAKTKRNPSHPPHPVDDHGGTDATSSSAAAAAVEPRERRIARTSAEMKPKVQGEQHAMPTAMLNSNWL